MNYIKERQKLFISAKEKREKLQEIIGKLWIYWGIFNSKHSN